MPKPENDPPPAPTICPFCRSPKISAPRDRVNASTYWRCETCGQMWNISRQNAKPPSRWGPY